MGVGGKWAHRIPPHPVSPQLTKIKLRSSIGGYANSNPGEVQMAKRIQFSAHGGPEVLEYVDYTPAEPGPQQVRVRNAAIGLNFIDTYYRSGLYAPPALPSGLGAEGAGVVDAVGSEVSQVSLPTPSYTTGHFLPSVNSSTRCATFSLL